MTDWISVKDKVCKGWWEMGEYSEKVAWIDDEVIGWLPLPSDPQEE